ncbi:CHAP domain-containing protein [uncultured Tenacibaculum sp.]|uniref:CHAP domain-containing protein n=1 Tax=uncultured Tenacibaculum sp. TaxID=174713 RepID=UPI0026265222|nr:CHAP domain-containing protein [uncultured Tenacibaculum sp.]
MKKIGIGIGILVLLFFGYKGIKKVNFNTKYHIGQKVDSIDNVYVYYNGGVDNVTERNTKDDYNLGLKYQCVEFVKRYYYEHYQHKMPDAYGHAKSFFDVDVSDGKINKRRNLIQYTNPSTLMPQKGDLIVFKGTLWNRYGHVAIISKVTETKVEIIQQNPGPFSSSREKIALINQNDNWKINNDRILGWLRK